MKITYLLDEPYRKVLVQEPHSRTILSMTTLSRYDTTPRFVEIPRMFYGIACNPYYHVPHLVFGHIDENDFLHRIIGQGTTNYVSHRFFKDRGHNFYACLGNVVEHISNTQELLNYFWKSTFCTGFPVIAQLLDPPHINDLVNYIKNLKELV